MRHSKLPGWLFPAAIGVAVALYFVPPIHSRLAWRIDDIRTRLVYLFHPPAEAVFRPTQQVDVTAIYGTTRAEYLQTLTPVATRTRVLGPTPTPTVTSTPPPPSVSLSGVVYVDQHGRWNYCGPANLAMALKFWGWTGDRDDIAEVVKPGSNEQKKNFIERGKPDKNVMPYEMVDFANEHTEFRALSRMGGDLDLIKRLLAGGFPVVLEKGYLARDTLGKVSWMGHYEFATGYDDGEDMLLVQDAYEFGPNYRMDYDEVDEGWRAFNRLFFVVYPPERERELLRLLGPWADEQWAGEHALATAEQEIEALRGLDQYFAWFNKGSSHVALQQYADAAVAYDSAFLLYGDLDCEALKCPFRMLWYQTGPYFAYYYAGRYHDVVNLAETTLETIADPTLEESLLWRGRARVMLGDNQAAINDFRAALAVHVDWLPALQALAELGAAP